MPTVVEIPNVGEVEFPDSMSPDQIRTQAQKLAQRPQQRSMQASGQQLPNQDLSGFMRAAGETVMENLLGIPRIINQGVGQLSPQGQIRTAAGLVQGQQPQPQGLRQDLNVPTASEVFGGAQRAGEMAGQARQRLAGQEQVPQVATQEQATQQQQALSQSLAQEQPTGAALGGITGDIATLATGRFPVARLLARRPRNVPQISDKTVSETLERVAQTNPELTPQVAQLVSSGRLASPSATRLWRRFKESAPAQSLLRGAGKAGETGIEGAVLGVLKDNDPLEMGGLAMGGQAASSIVGTAVGLPRSVKGLVTKAALMTGLWRLGQSLAPTVEGDIFESIDVGFDKVAAGFTLGLAAELVGGRLRGSKVGGRFAEDLPRLTDTMNAIPRGGVLSIMNTIRSEQEEGENTTLNFLNELSQNPMAFSESTRNRVNRAIEKGTLNEEIEKLKKNSRFQKTLEELGI